MKINMAEVITTVLYNHAEEALLEKFLDRKGYPNIKFCRYEGRETWYIKREHNMVTVRENPSSTYQGINRYLWKMAIDTLEEKYWETRPGVENNIMVKNVEGEWHLLGSCYQMSGFATTDITFNRAWN